LQGTSNVFEILAARGRVLHVVEHQRALEHRAKKWEPVFRKSDATTNK
jgi:hypothetical protein